MRADKRYEVAIARFMDTVRSVRPTQAQSRLLNTKDRDLAAVLFSANELDRGEIYALVGEAKAARLRLELDHMGHVHLDPETVDRISSHLCDHIVSEHPLGSASRYFRPHRPS